jgi:glycosyltransferase involved in cell wall biosynthesis
MDVSVIIPVYNTEKYLDECLKSVENQTLKEIEIILDRFDYVFDKKTK